MNTLFRVTGFTENNSALTFAAEYLPRPQTGEPFSEPKDLEKKLVSLFEKHSASLVKNLCKHVKLISIDVWSKVTGQSKRVEKLETLRFYVEQQEVTFLAEFSMLSITLKIIPSLTPIFEDGFEHTTSIYSEELDGDVEKAD